MLLPRTLFASPTSCKKKGAGVSKLDRELARPVITDLTAYSQVAAVNSFNEYKSGSKTNISSGFLSEPERSSFNHFVSSMVDRWRFSIAAHLTLMPIRPTQAPEAGQRGQWMQAGHYLTFSLGQCVTCAIALFPDKFPMLGLSRDDEMIAVPVETSCLSSTRVLQFSRLTKWDVWCFAHAWVAHCTPPLLPLEKVRGRRFSRPHSKMGSSQYTELNIQSEYIKTQNKKSPVSKVIAHANLQICSWVSILRRFHMV